MSRQGGEPDPSFFCLQTLGSGLTFEHLKNQMSEYPAKARDLTPSSYFPVLYSKFLSSVAATSTSKLATLAKNVGLICANVSLAA
jgi:hypothetical protein